MTRQLTPSLARVGTGLLGVGLALTTSPSYAAAAGSAVRPSSPSAQARGYAARPLHLTEPELARVRERQAGLRARHQTVPTFAAAARRAGVKPRRLTVDTTEDSPLAHPDGTRCVDAATGACSLRAAVEAADNRRSPVKILLRGRRYLLSTGEQLTVHNPAGTSVVGTGTRHTVIRAQGSRAFEEAQLHSGSAAPLLFVRNLAVTGGSTDVGAGFLLDDGATGATLVLDHVAVSGNTGQTGGAVAALGSDTLYAAHSSFSGNVAANGGALYTYWSDVSLTDVTISDNHTPAGHLGSGGGWMNEYGVLDVKGGSISGNSAGGGAVPGYGGGVFDLYGDVRLDDVHLDRNTVGGSGGNGGGWYGEADLLRVSRGTISHNHASGSAASGGGLALTEGNQVDLRGVMMAGNRVSGDVVGGGSGHGGGAVFVDAQERPTRLRIGSGTTIKRSNASAVYATAQGGQVDVTLDHSRLRDNTDALDNGLVGQGCGGAVCLLAQAPPLATLSTHGAEILDNTSRGDQGSGGISVWTGGNAMASVHLARTLFRGNTTGAHGLGGAIGAGSTVSGSPATVVSEHNTFLRNAAGGSRGQGHGGALGTEGDTVLSDVGSRFHHNRARGEVALGGAVYSDGQQSSRFHGSVFTGNSSGPALGGAGRGGAVWANDPAGTSFVRVTVTGNHATSLGGGLDTSSNGYSVSVRGSTIADNRAGSSGQAGYGGGINANNAALTVENSTIAHNRASGDDGHGGGVYSEGSVLGLRYSTVVGNVAQHGGGVFDQSTGGVLLGSIVTGNHASPRGSEQDCDVASVVQRLHSLGGNLLGQQDCVTALSSGDRVTRRPRLGRLKDNGGPTRTKAPTRRSPALGVATFQCPPTDQRGHVRPARHCDAGSVELRQARHHHHPHSASDRTQP